MARCPDCNKFVGNEQADPELNLEVSLNEDKSATVTGDVRMVLTCADCSTELAEANSDVEVELEHIDIAEGTEHDVEIESESAESTDRYDGKPNTPSRYRRHYYGASISGTVKCTCGATADFITEAEEQAGGFDSLV